VFYQLWEKYGESVIAKLQQQSIAPLELASADWRLSINVYVPPVAIFQGLVELMFVLVRGQDDAAKQKGTYALFQFNLQDNADDKAPQKKLQLEMSQDELVYFYNQLETIQQQLDAVQQQ